MDYKAHFDQRADTCGGVPIVKGTRIPIKTVLSNLKAGRSKEEILKDYPTLKADDIQAVVMFAAASAEEDLPTGRVQAAA